MSDDKAEALRQWYLNDAGINWGSDGDWQQCVDIASQYMSDAEGYCTLRHQDATGAAPGHASGEKSLATDELAKAAEAVRQALLPELTQLRATYGLLGEAQSLAKEERDDQGRWTSGGGCDSGSKVNSVDRAPGSGHTGGMTGTQKFDPERHEVVTAKNLSPGDRVASRGERFGKPGTIGPVVGLQKYPADMPRTEAASSQWLEAQPTFRTVESVGRGGNITFTDGVQSGAGAATKWVRAKN